jgi:hypothetical protein
MTRHQSSNIRQSMDLPANDEQVLQRYEAGLARQQSTLQDCSRRWTRVGYLRGCTFLLSLPPLLLALNQVWGVSGPWVWLSGLIFVAFLVVAFFHERIQFEMRQAGLLVNMHRASIARLKRDWSGIKTIDLELPVEFRPVATDLDLTGESSLFKLIGITRTPLGTSTLRDWIVTGALPGEVTARQQAVAELALDVEWREKFRLNCEQLAASQSGPSQFVEWAESRSWLDGRGWLLWLSRLTGLTSLLSIGLMLSGLLPLTIAGPLLMAAIAINFVVSVFYAGAIHDIFNMISSRRDEINFYVTLFDLVADFPAKSTRLREIQDRMLRSDHDARQQINRLGTLVWLANIRRNGVLFIIYLMSEFLFFWDIHVLHLLEKWKSSNGAKARGWFDDLGQWEAIGALAKLKADQPQWVFPEVADSTKQDALIDCRQLGHPLLDTRRVCNDVQIGPAGTVLLVSGSNMSGKSTLLRSIGVNVVLAQMGSVVCAKKMTLPPVHIETSMRIIDSLADGVSFFMAELKRLKQIVDRGREFGQRSDRTMLFLLDEILQGTNSRERQIAVSRVVRKLIDEFAIGAISTHDLDLATTEDLKLACRCVHFSEQFHDRDGKREMTFDYRMRRGIAETTNALKLLEMVGLGEHD